MQPYVHGHRDVWMPDTRLVIAFAITATSLLPLLPTHPLATFLPDVAFTCRRQLRSFINYSPPRHIHHLFCRVAALCTVSCLRLPQPVCTSPLPLLTQHLLRSCSPGIRPRDLSAYCPLLTFYLSHRLIRTQSATRSRLHRPRVGALWTRADAEPFFLTPHHTTHRVTPSRTHGSRLQSKHCLLGGVAALLARCTSFLHPW